MVSLNIRIRELLGSKFGLKLNIHHRLRMCGLLCLLNSFKAWCLFTGTFVYKIFVSFYDVTTAYVPVFIPSRKIQLVF